MQCSMNFLSVISKKQKELRNRTYKTERQREFIANERGKERAITSTRIEDRIVRHSICDNVLVPELTPKLIYDNGASVRDKGVDFTRKEFEKHLHMLFNENKCNDGWILFGDFSKYYDNIPHDQLISDVGNVISDEFSMWLYSVIVDASKVDVSGLTDEEVQGLMNGVFNSIDYRKADFERKGEKYIAKSLDIGDQASQISGVFYPTPIDNYVKIVRQHKMYDRYMDDFAIMHKDKEYLLETLEGIYKIADSKGIHINKKKTYIVKASSVYTFLQMKYSLGKAGHVTRKMQNKKITKQCDKLRALQKKFLAGEITYKDVEQNYKSWFKSHIKYLTKKQRRKLNNVYNDLFIKNFAGGTNYEYNIEITKRRDNRKS